MHTPPEGKPERPPRTARRRRVRAAAFALGVLLLLAVLTLLIVTRSPVLTRLVAPRLAEALGGDVTIGHASFASPGVLVLRVVDARAPGVAGEAGRVLAIDRLEARLDWPALLAGRMGVREVVFDSPTIRLSQNGADGSLNIASLAPRRTGGAPVELPAVRVRRAIVEFGEHNAGPAAGYTPLASITVDGELSRSARNASRYRIALVEARASALARAPANPVPVVLTGEYDPLAVAGSLTLENVDLASWGPGAAPSGVRDFWTELALAGRVRSTEFLYDRTSGVRARFAFDNVSLALPIEADPQADLDMNPGPREGPTRSMRISGASGVATIGSGGIEAEIAGLIEDLRYRVAVTAPSVDLDTPFIIRFETAEPFSIAERPQLLPFAPPIVRERFQSFSGPTAMMEASVVVTRGDPLPDGPAPVRIAGELSFTDGQASYASFPYPIHRMAGRVRFDDEAIHIDEITGVAPTGATLRATGVIAPPVEGAEVAIDIVIDKVPLDDAFNAAMPASRADLLGALFNKAAEAELRARGLLPDAFTLGGVGTLDIAVRRALGHDSRWLWNAVLTLPEAGLLVERFPYPAIARNAVVRVWDDRAQADIPDIRPAVGPRGPWGPRGRGRADLHAEITLHDERGESVFQPTIVVRAEGIAIDERLLHALPGAFDTTGDRTTPQMLRDLALAGNVRTTARVAPRDDGEIGFDVALEFDDLVARPAGPDAPPLRDIRGRLHVSETGVRVDALTGRLGDASLSLTGDLGYDSVSERPTDLSLVAAGLALHDPFDRVLAAFEPQGADAVRAALASADAQGVVDATVRVTRAPGADRFDANVSLDAVRSLSFNALGGRVTVDSAQGGAVIAVGGQRERVARFGDFSASVRFDRSAPTAVTLDGELDLRAFIDTPADTEPGAPRNLRASASLAWPSAFADAALARAAPARASRVRDALAAWGVRLEAGLSLAVRSTPGEISVAELSATPRALTLSRNGATAAFAVESGSIRYADDALRLDALTLRNDQTFATISGDASLAGSPSLNLDIAGAVCPLDGAGRALLPDAIRPLFESADIAAARLDVLRARVAIAEETIADASLLATGLSFDLGGADVSDVDASLALSIDTADERPIDATLRFDAARVGRVWLGQGEARVVAIDHGRTLVIPTFDAQAYGGRVFGVARLDRGTSARDPLRYEVEGAMAGVSFDALRNDLNIDDASAPDADDPRGLLDATIAVAGVAGRPNDRLGRGAVRVWGGEVVRLPLASRLIELSNLQLPTGEEIDFAQARFYIEGGVVTFEELGAASASVTLDAQGSLRWPSLELDLRVTSRGARRAPLLSDLVEAFRDELLISRVTGPLSDPTFTVETLPSTRRLLDSIFGGRKDRPEPARPAPRAPSR